jgi:hypothetical protein
MKVRINNIEARTTDTRYEIVKHYPNTYYGTEEEMIKEGYVKTTFGDGLIDFALSRNHHTVHGSCFENKEFCYVIAVLDYVEDEACCDLTTIGPRVLNLDEEERRDFFDVYALAEKMVRKENERKDEEE